jgi:hypothetical protein
MAAAVQDESRGDDEVYHRDNIFEFFRNHTAYDMLPESGKVRPPRGPPPARIPASCACLLLAAAAAYSGLDLTRTSRVYAGHSHGLIHLGIQRLQPHGS